jgi:hypothetical protein
MVNMILNIGLNRNDGGKLDVDDIYDALIDAGASIEVCAVHHSETEETVVVSLRHPLVARTVLVLARSLHQDCIARYSLATGEGDLIGPNPWGEFDASQFLLIDGSVLDDTHAGARCEVEENEALEEEAAR